MAEVNFKPKGDIQIVVSQTSADLGTARAVGDTWTALQVTDFSFSHASAPLEVAPPRASTYGQLENMGHHRPDTQMYEASLTCRGTPNSILPFFGALMGDGESAVQLTSASNTGAMKHGTASATSMDILFENAGSDAASMDVLMKSCFATSVTIKEDIGTNGGELVVEATLVTAYRPEELALTPTTITAEAGVPFNIFSLTTQALNAEPLMLNSWEITASRSIDRVGYSETTNYLPFGYVQTGPYEVTGTLVCKRDDSIFDLAAQMKGTSAGLALVIGDGTLVVSCPDVMIDNSSPEISDYLLQTIPFRAFGATEGADILSITTS